MNSLEGLVSGLLAETHTTRKALAANMGCTPETLKNKLNGRAAFTVRDAYVIASTLGGDTEKTFNEVCHLALKF
ncbi:MAG: hypothetical protein E6148_01785 [Atopobium minutum]|uniref:hypothetical protein n=1 Tax=Atopobium minutum TaxID=1381 RepID=UPI002912202E|nr:hypothetical protein [Atopobium minutum]MDU5356763.1 hypothetical protein [Atopobium minutum]